MQNTGQEGSIQPRDIYSWTGQLASESRPMSWIVYWYVWPKAVAEVIHKLETMSGGIICLVGLQGVGKSSGLLAITVGRAILKNEEYRKTHKSSHAPNLEEDFIRFKWRRQFELFPSLLDRTHEAAAAFHRDYSITFASETQLIQVSEQNR